MVALQLSLIYNNISDVTPLAKLTNLTWLAIRDNPITDTSPLASLKKLVDVDVKITAPSLIPDPNLAASIRETLGLDPKAVITKQSMQKLTTLNAANREITNLAGLGHASQLTRLHLQENQIRDISPLRFLKRLSSLELWDNQIRDISPLAGLTNLTELYLNDNQISDFTPIAGLTKLRRLGLGQNKPGVRDITPLRGLTRVVWLNLYDGQIRDISPLAKLTQLESLYLERNQISDVSSLAGLTRLKDLRLAENNIRDVSPLAKLVNLEKLWLVGNPITNTSPLASLTKLVEVDIKIAMPVSKGLIPDSNLAAAVREALDLAPNASITKQALQRLTTLAAGKRRITSLTGLEHATQLTVSYLWGNQIQDVSPLAKLTQLETLNLEGNQIQTASPLAGLTKLESLNLGRNQISDIRPLAKLTQLVRLWLHENQIRAVNPLAGLTQLEMLNLGENQINDTSPLAGLTKLENLVLRRNRIQDLTPLAELTQSEALELQGNQIQDVSPLVNLINLKKLRIGGNPIQDTSPLASLTKLVEVDVEITAVVAIVNIFPSHVPSPAIGEQLTFSLKIANGKNVAGYQATITYDTSALRYIESSSGDYLPIGAFFVPPVVNRNRVQLGSTALTGVSNGDGTLATLTFEVIKARASTLTLSDVFLADSEGNTVSPQVENGQVTEPVKVAEDLNTDGVVNIQDLVLVASNFGQIGENVADVNGDGVVNITDLVKVAGALGNAAAAPSLHPQTLAMFTTADVRQWLSQAQHLNLMDATSQRGIRFLAQLLAALIPKETALLSNYPNPFNPETWIPYQLAKPTDVTLTIYAVNGQVVRRLFLGHQLAGVYQSRSHAAYWDGKNALGEPVASGLYFYTLTAGDFTATRKMIIMK